MCVCVCACVRSCVRACVAVSTCVYFLCMRIRIHVRTYVRLRSRVRCTYVRMYIRVKLPGKSSYLWFEDNVHSLVPVRLHLANSSRQTGQIHRRPTHVDDDVCATDKGSPNFHKVIPRRSGRNAHCSVVPYIVSVEIHTTRRK